MAPVTGREEAGRPGPLESGQVCGEGGAGHAGTAARPRAWRLHSYLGMNVHMAISSPPGTRRITANLDADLLRKACSVTGEGITETLALGLEMVRRSAAASRARALRGKLRLDLDLEGSRERARR